MKLPAQQSLAFTERPPVLRAFLGLSPTELCVDNFAGGGGASTGIAAAIGRDPDIAINHDPEAIAMHRANHPNTRHYVEDVYRVDPVAACAGRPVGLAWFSPDCTHHSKAKGGKPRKAKIRGLAWVAVRWAAAVAPRIIVLENVEEFRDWGPLIDGQPDPKRKGKTFRAFVRKLERLGYAVDHWLIRACDHGAPTTRRRMFLVARNDGRPIVRPEATHGPGRAPYRTAAEVIDWTDLGSSIFERDKALVPATLARVARGVERYVIRPDQRFIAPVSVGELGDHRLAVAYLVHRSNGERVGQAPRIYDIRKPLGTIVAQGQKHALCVAFLAKHYSGDDNHGIPVTGPVATITAVDHHALVAAFLVRYNGTGDAESVERPIGTLTSLPRFGLVTVIVDGATWVLVDIRMRMLKPRELFNAQGFPIGYVIDSWTKTAQIRMCGNSVSPPPAAATVRAQLEAA